MAEAVRGPRMARRSASWRTEARPDSLRPSAAAKARTALAAVDAGPVFTKAQLDKLPREY